MRYADDRYHLGVEFSTRECRIPADELTRMQASLEPLGEAVREFHGADLAFNVIYHPNSQVYNIAARLRVPGQTLFSADKDTYLDTAYQRCVQKLVRKVASYCEAPDRDAQDQARRQALLNREIVMPQDPADGVVGRAVERGDYRAFRRGLAGYEDWLAKRVGRWVQRYPDVEAHIGDGIRIGDLVEEVYLNAFEDYRRRSTEVSLGDWLDSLIDPSLKLLLKHPDEERANVSMARTLCDMPLP